MNDRRSTLVNEDDRSTVDLDAYHDSSRFPQFPSGDMTRFDGSQLMVILPKFSNAIQHVAVARVYDRSRSCPSPHKSLLPCLPPYLLFIPPKKSVLGLACFFLSIFPNICHTGCLPFHLSSPCSARPPESLPLSEKRLHCRRSIGMKTKRDDSSDPTKGATGRETADGGGGGEGQEDDFDDIFEEDDDNVVELNEDDMLEEWVERGLDPASFEPQILMEIWEAEEEVSISMYSLNPPK